MNIVIDTNILIRFILADDENQYKATIALFEKAESITIPAVVLCETAWVLRNYKFDKKIIAKYIRAIAQSDKIIVADDEVNAGLDLLESGGDFADGVIAYTGRKLSPHKTALFASFDQTAVRLLNQNDYSSFIPIET